MSKTTIRKGKQDDKFSLAIREIQSSMVENKKCFDCEQRGPTYVNITVGSFVCTKCSGMLRGINPPHRIKSISMSTFTPEEVELMRGKGNLWCSKVWLATYDFAANPVDYKDEDKIKDFMIAKYERKRYYVEPSDRTILPKSSSSVSSLSSASSMESKPLSTLIGTTLKAHMTQPSSSAAVSRPNPGSLPRPQEMRIQSKPQLPPQPAAQPPPPSQTQSESFADFANFDAVAFDSLPADPLTAPFPTNTLPPLRKISQVSNNNSAEPPNTKVANAGSSNSQQDRYSALKELDDLFRSTTIQSPGPAESAPEFLGSTPAPIPKTNGIFGEQCGSPGLGRSSPAGWTNNAPAWTPSWNQTSSAGGGWAAQEGGWGGVTQSSTNPFGTSPSGPVTSSINLPENNNDLFAAAPKPFFSGKPGLDLSGGNPWSNVPAFTPNMTPAPNPNNPFL